jgi:hypothetical protein
MKPTRTLARRFVTRAVVWSLGVASTLLSGSAAAEPATCLSPDPCAHAPGLVLAGAAARGQHGHAPLVGRQRLHEQRRAVRRRLHAAERNAPRHEALLRPHGLDRAGQLRDVRERRSPRRISRAPASTAAPRAAPSTSSSSPTATRPATRRRTPSPPPRTSTQRRHGRRQDLQGPHARHQLRGRQPEQHRRRSPPRAARAPRTSPTTRCSSRRRLANIISGADPARELRQRGQQLQRLHGRGLHALLRRRPDVLRVGDRRAAHRVPHHYTNRRSHPRTRTATSPSCRARRRAAGAAREVALLRPQGDLRQRRQQLPRDGVDEASSSAATPRTARAPSLQRRRTTTATASIDEGVCNGCIPSPEVCDGCDNDCDGLVDEGIPSAACGLASPPNCAGQLACPQKANPGGVPVGACAGGNGFGACSNNPQTEVCDGIDNNCDGVVDDGIGADPVRAGRAAQQPRVRRQQPVQAGHAGLRIEPVHRASSGRARRRCATASTTTATARSTTRVFGVGQPCGLNQPPCTPGTHRVRERRARVPGRRRPAGRGVRRPRQRLRRQRGRRAARGRPPPAA